MARRGTYDSILDTVGDTPMVRLNRMVPDGCAEVYAKLESFNPMSSVKDRVAKAMIEAAERRGKIGPGTTVVEPTSGNTGIGLAMVCAAKGYRLVLTMPDSASGERRRLLRALGAELVLTPGAEGMVGAVKRAEDIANGLQGSYMPQQFKNRANPAIHKKTTAKEIMRSLDRVDAFVAGVGSGGTITGVGLALKRKFQDVKIIAVEPDESPVLSGGEPHPHPIQGIGAGFVPEIFDRSVCDGIVRVKSSDAAETSRALARKEGILAGISSGAALHAAMGLARELGPGKKIVVLLPDTGERYLSTDLFGD